VKILILGLNYAPEPVGIGPYTTGMAEALVRAGHNVSMVSGKPYYPHWRSDSAYARGGYRRSVENGVEITRCPIYVPASPTGAKRLAHHASFAVTALPAMLARACRFRPDVVMTIAPSLIAMPVARIAAMLAGAKLWLHIQDFEVEAAFATGLINPRSRIARAARAFEDWSLTADRISTISPQMCSRLAKKGVPTDKVVEFRNWASIDSIRPLPGPSSFRAEWSLDRRYVALYSGNIANKQGIELVIEAARLLAPRRDLILVVCGNGANREALAASADGLDNIRFCDLQPMARLSDLLGLADVHLLPQIAGAADLVLPSKLTNMLASGRPVIATALPGTGLADEVAGCGVCTPPGDASAFAAAITALLNNEEMRARFGIEARRRAEQRWSKDAILASFEAELRICATEPHRAGGKRLPTGREGQSQ
jgi:colanic acid biosynthesis glycosyl transferase WcaI